MRNNLQDINKTDILGKRLWHDMDDPHQEFICPSSPTKTQLHTSRRPRKLTDLTLYTNFSRSFRQLPATLPNTCVYDQQQCARSDCAENQSFDGENTPKCSQAWAAMRLHATYFAVSTSLSLNAFFWTGLQFCPGSLGQESVITFDEFKFWLLLTHAYLTLPLVTRLLTATPIVKPRGRAFIQLN